MAQVMGGTSPATDGGSPDDDRCGEWADARTTNPRPADTVAYNTAVLQQHAQMVRRFCRSRTTNADDAEEAAQETFVRFLNRHLPEELAHPESWLIAVAARACVDVYRARLQRSMEQPTSDEHPSSEVDPARQVVENLATQDLLDQLTPQDRRILTSLYLQGMSAPQLARQLKVSAGNLRIMAMRARQRARHLAEAMGHTLGVILFLPRLVRHGDRLRKELQRRLSTLMNQPAWLSLPAKSVTLALLAPGVITLSAGLTWLKDKPLPSIASLRLSSSSTADPSTLDTRAYPGADAQQGPSSAGDRPPPPSTSGPGAEPRSPATGSGASGAASSDGAGSPTAGQLLPPSGPLTTMVTGVLPAGGAGAEGATPSAIPPGEDGSSIGPSGSSRPCGSGCSVSFRSSASGHSWRRLRGEGHAAVTHLLLPPDYPANPTIFASSPLGLQRSDDGGTSFQLLVGLPAPMAVDPHSPVRDTHITIGTVPLMTYQQRSGAVLPGPTLPPEVTAIDDLDYTAAGDLLLTARIVSPAAWGQAHTGIVLCPGTGAGPCSLLQTPPM